MSTPPNPERLDVSEASGETNLSQREQDAQSDQRNRRLEEYANIHADFSNHSFDSIRVELVPSAPTAGVTFPHNEDETDSSRSNPDVSTEVSEQVGTNNDVPVVLIPGRPREQRATSLTPAEFDRHLQFAELIHEHGHIRYTAGPAFHRLLNEDWYEPFSQTLNNIIQLAEDGAIETFLREDYSRYVAERLALKNDNKHNLSAEQRIEQRNNEQLAKLKALIEQMSGRDIDKEEVKNLPEFQQNKLTVEEYVGNITISRALITASMDLSKANTGRLKKIIHGALTQEDIDNIGFIADLHEEPADADEWSFINDKHKDAFVDLLPVIERLMRTVKSMRDGKQRCEFIQNTVEDINSYLEDTFDPDETPDSGNSSAEGNQEGNSMSSYGSQQSQPSPTKRSQQTQKQQTSNAVGGTVIVNPDNKQGTGEQKENKNDSEQQPSEDKETGEDNSGQQENKEQKDSKQGGEEEDETPHGEGQSTLGQFNPDADNQDENGDSNQKGNQSDQDKDTSQQSEEDDQTEGEKNDDRDAPHTDEAPHEPSEEANSKNRKELYNERSEREEIVHQLEQELQGFDQNQESNSTGGAQKGGSGASNTDLGSLDINPKTDNPFNSSRWQDAIGDTDNFIHILEDRLQEERKDSRKGGRRYGRPDPKALSSVPAGNMNAMFQTERGEDKKYSAILVLDRSSSMSGVIGTAEHATIAFANGLEELGVETCILDFKSSVPRYISPFSKKVTSDRKRIATGEYSGGTPLTDVLEVADTLFQERASDVPFIVAITDGKPGSKNDYLDKLEELSARRIHVLGLTLAIDGTNTRGNERYYTAHEYVETEDELVTAMQQLCQQIIF
jgi:hypothetical protein